MNQDFPSKVFCLTVPRNSIGESFGVSLFLGIETNWIKGGGSGEYKNFPLFFLSDSAEKICRAALLCCISENCRERKSLDERVGECQDFLSKFFGLTVPKNFVEETFCAVFQKNYRYRKIYRSDGRGRILGGVWLVLGIEKFYASVGYVTIFCQIILSDGAEKFCRKTLQCCNSEKFR